MSRKSGNVSIKQIQTAAESSQDGTISLPTVVNDAVDVENVVQNLINDDTILDEEDVNELIDVKLQDYTTTTNLQNDYVTKILLTNTLDNYTSKELLTQSLSDRPTFTITDALNTTTTNHENRISAIENNFVSTTSLVEILTPQQQQVNTALAGKASSSHTYTIGDLNYDSSNSLKSVIDNKASVIHTHTLSQITDYAPTDLTNVEEDINELTEQVLAIEESLNGVASSSHTHTADEIGMPYQYYESAWDSSTGESVMQKITGITPLSELLRYDYAPNSSYIKLTVLKKLESSNTIVGSNVLANNETRLAACESRLTAQTFDSSTDSLKSILRSMPDTSLKIINDFLSSTWTTMLIRGGEQRAFALAVNKLRAADSIRMYWNGASNGDYAFNANLYDIILTNNNVASYAAKLDTANTFTAAQTINSTNNLGLNINTTYYGEWLAPIHIMAGSMAKNNTLVIKFGKNTTSDNNAAYIGYQWQGDASTNSFIDFGFQNNDHLFKMLASGTFVAPAITLNGTDLATTLNNCAKLNAANTFTGMMSLTADSNAVPLRVFSSNSGYSCISVGVSASDNNSSNWRYNKTTKCMELGFWGNDNILNINPNKTVSIASGGQLSTPSITLTDTVSNILFLPTTNNNSSGIIWRKCGGTLPPVSVGPLPLLRQIMLHFKPIFTFAQMIPQTAIF